MVVVPILVDDHYDHSDGFATEDKQVQHRPTSFLFAVTFNPLPLNPFFCSLSLPVLPDGRLLHIIRDGYHIKWHRERFKSVAGTIEPCCPFYRHSQKIDGLCGFRQPSQSSSQEKCEEGFSVYRNGCWFVISVINLRRGILINAQESLVLASRP